VHGSFHLFLRYVCQLLVVKIALTRDIVFPMYSTVLWKRQNKAAILFAPPLGSMTAIACWLASANALEGDVTVASTSAILPLVIGNSVSLVSGSLYAIILTFAFGNDNFDWSRFKTELKVIDDSDVKGLTAEQLEQQLAGEHLSPEDDKALLRGKKVGSIMAVVLCLIFVVLFPLPMYGTHYIFSKPFYRFWVVLTFFFAWIAALVILIMPVWQGRHSLLLFWRYITGKRGESLVKEGPGLHLDGTGGTSPADEPGMVEEKATEKV